MGNNAILALLPIYLFTCVIASFNSSTDEYALLAFKSQISDPNKILTKNWSQGTSFCNWIGITCGKKHPRVLGLNLANMGLKGTLAREIGNLSFLRSLVISNNNFHGFIPYEIGNLSRLREIDMQYNDLHGPIPTSFGFLENLQKLTLLSNELSGHIPNQISNLSSLVEIDFANNSLSGSIPIDIGNNLPKLETVRISKNQIGGSIPPSLGRCTKLKRISLSFNNLNGSIPMEIWNLSELQHLYLAENNLIGSIPNEIGNLLSLQWLELGSNNLTGTIPYSIGNVSNLEIFNMDTNNIQGRIPRELGHLSLLKIIDFPVNHLEGEIPESIFNLSRLQNLSLTLNKLSGNLPSSLNNGLPVLGSLYLAGNGLSGELPSGISNFSKLSILDLTQNSFSGQVPMTLGNLRDLQILSLQYNQLKNDPSMVELDFLSPLTNCGQLKTLRFGYNSFNGMLPKVLGNLSQSVETITGGFSGIKGMIPVEIGNLSNMIYFAMGGNDLTGTIPDTMGQMRKMQKLIIRRNKMWGSIPVNLCNVEDLYHLDLSYNQLSGQLPRCLGNISSLRNIYLNYNGLTSTIPSTLWSNKEIQILELSHNLLIGSLSQEIGSMKSLRELHLSENQFSGNIPTIIGELQSLINLTLSDNSLQGPIPESFGDLKGLEYLDLSHNNLSGMIPKSLESLQYLKYLNISFNKLSGEIPNGGPFKNLTRDSFIGNGELCGASRFMVMPCKSNTSKSSSKTRYLKYILPPCALVACIVIVAVWFVRSNRNKPLPTQSSLPIALTVKRISYYDVLSATNNFDEENLIGRGSIGSVYKGLFSDGIIAAIKVFNLDVEGALKSFYTECSILCNIRHRNLVKVITCCSNLDLKALVLEYMPKGNLSNWLYSSDYCLNIVQRLEIMIDVASALEYLHHECISPIVHCDLKPNNILLDEDMVARVADFGISKLFKEDQRISQTKTLGTIGYMAPEYGSTGLISTMADVYSYGILLMETFTKKKPTEAIFEGELTMRRWVVESFHDAIMQIVDIDVVDEVEENIRSIERCITSIMGLSLECTSDLPEERLNMKDVLIRLEKIKTEFLPGITMRVSQDALGRRGPILGCP